MGNIDELMGIERDMDLLDPTVEPVQQSGQPLGVRAGTRHRQRRIRYVAKIVLRIDDQAFETHDGSPPLGSYAGSDAVLHGTLLGFFVGVGQFSCFMLL